MGTGIASSLFTARALLAAILLASGAAAASACVEDTDASPAQISIDAAFDVGAGLDSSTPLGDAAPADAPGGETSVTDATLDATALDANVVDAPVDGGRPSAGYRVANVSATAIDFCVWSPADPEPTLPAFAASGGVPAGAVSAYFPFGKMGVNFNFKYTPAGSTCAAATDAGFAQLTENGNLAPYRTRWLSDVGGLLGGGFIDLDAPTAGKERVLFTRMQSASATLQFIPDADGGVDAGPPISILNNVDALLDPNITGQLVGNVPGVGTPPARPFKTTGGGVVRIFMTGSQILVCDELAPPVGPLSDCRASVRAP